MTILLVAPDMRTLGGFETQMAALAIGLSQVGHAVTVIIREPVRSDHPLLIQMRDSGIKVRYPTRLEQRILAPSQRWRETVRSGVVIGAIPLLAIAALLDAVARGRSFRRSMHGAIGRWSAIVGRFVFADGLTWRFARTLDRELRRSPPDIIDVQHSMLPFGISYAVANHIPVVYTEYGAPSMKFESIWAGLRPVVNLADLIIGRAEASLTGLHDVCGWQADRPSTIVSNVVLAGPSAADEQNLSLPDDGQGVVISTIGRLSPEKGTSDVLAAVELLARDGLPVRLVLAGEGPMRESLQRYARQHSLSDRIKFLGEFDDLAPIMRATHIFAHPTLNDGRSVSVLEAMAWGRPVVGTDVGGVKELIRDGTTGFIVPAGDPVAMAEALRRLVADKVLRQEMGSAGRSVFLVGGHSVEQMVGQTVAAYDRAIRSYNARLGSVGVSS